MIEAEGDTVVVEVETTDPALVVIAQPEYPGWRAQVDGDDVGIVRVDDAFPGVPVPAGRHTVILRYRPSDLPLATALTGLGLLGLAVTWWVGGTRPRRAGVATLAR